MEQEGGSYLALLVDENTTTQEAAELVRQRLRSLGRAGWEAMELEIYPGEGETLVIARERNGERMYFSAFALRYLLEWG